MNKSIKRFMIFFVLFVLLIQITSTVSATNAGNNNSVATSGNNELDYGNCTALTNSHIPNIHVVDVNGTKYGDKTKISVAVYKEGVKAIGKVILMYGNGFKYYNGACISYLHNGIATFDLGVLHTGDYIMHIIYCGDENFNATNATSTFSIQRVAPDMHIAPMIDIKDHSAIVLVKVNENATGKIKITVGDYCTEWKNVTNGIVAFKVPKEVLVGSGTEKVYAIYSGDNNFYSAKDSASLQIPCANLS